MSPGGRASRALVIALLSAAAHGQTLDLVVPAADLRHEDAPLAALAEAVHAESAGGVSVRILTAAGERGAGAVRDGVRDGVVALGALVLADLAHDDPVLALDAIPYLADDAREVHNLWAASRAGVARALGAHGLRILLVQPSGPVGLYADRRIDTSADLRDLRVSVAHPGEAAFVRRLGAVAVPMAPADAPAAFRRGEVDAVLASPALGRATSAWEWVRYFHDLRASRPKRAVVASESALAALEPRGRRALIAAAEAVEARIWERVDTGVEDVLDGLRMFGLVVRAPDARLVRALESAGRAVTAQWTERAGLAGVRVVEDFHARNLE